MSSSVVRRSAFPGFAFPRRAEQVVWKQSWLMKRLDENHEHPLGYRPISSQTCCTVATAPGTAMVGRKQLSSADQMAFWLTSAVHRERFLLNGVFVDRFQAPSGQAFCLAECWLWEKFLQLFVDRTRPFLHRLWRSSSGHEGHDIWKPNHHYCTKSTLDRDELGAALLFWNSSSDRCCCEHADASWRENDGPVRKREQVILKKNCPEESRCWEEQTEFLQKH